MLYKPTYCSNCGGTIERTERFIWTSLSFCQVCEKEHKIFAHLPLILSSIICLLVLFGFGNYLFSESSEVSTVKSEQSRIKTLKTGIQPKNENGNLNQNATFPPVENVNNQDNAAKIEQVQNEIPKTITQKMPQPTVRKLENVPVVEAESVYFCGAQTKKGTPCSRKVKGGGRCWQHEGLEAMLSKEKLLIGH